MDMMVWLKGAKESQTLDLTSDFASMLATPDGKNELYQLAKLVKIDLAPLLAFGGNDDPPKARARQELLDAASALQAGWKKHRSKIKPFLSDIEFMKDYFEEDFAHLVSALKKKGDAKVYLWAELS
jgi:hypothetical protein